MKMCPEHYTKLREAINSRGLAVLVAEDSEEAVRKILGANQFGMSIDTFEPLLDAVIQIGIQAFSILGPRLSLPNADGTDQCPLCALNLFHQIECTDPTCHIADYEHWIDCAADDQLRIWQSLRL